MTTVPVLWEGALSGASAHLDPSQVNGQLSAEWLLERAAVEIDSDGYADCPAPGCDSTKFHLFTSKTGQQRFGCWRAACDAGGDTVALLMLLNTCDFAGAMKLAGALLPEYKAALAAGWAPTFVPRVREYEDPDVLSAKAAEYRAGASAEIFWDALRVEPAAWHGLTMEELRSLWYVGTRDISWTKRKKIRDPQMQFTHTETPMHSRGLTIPHYSNRGQGFKAHGIKIREALPDPKRAHLPDGDPDKLKVGKTSESGSDFDSLYGLWLLRGCEWVLLTEGERDAWVSRKVLTEAGAAWDVLSLPRGAKSPVTPEALQVLAGKHVVFGFDADRSGEEAFARWAAQVQPVAASVWRVPLPEGAKDLASCVDPLGALKGAVQVTSTELAGPEAIWEARPSLGRLRDWARARLASPWAVLGVTMAHAIAAIPPSTVLPPIIGVEASLNFFVALVGPSGAGKGAAEGVARAASRFKLVQRVSPLGSGEAMVAAYWTGTPKNLERHPDSSIVFSAPEIDNLAALAGRSSSTLMSELRMAWSGEQVGHSYLSKSCEPLDPHSYRLCLSVGVQPERAEALLSEAGGGTPQRFTWMPVTDPDATLEDTAPPQVWDYTSVLRWEPGPLEVPEVCRRTVREANHARRKGQGDALDGHALLQREKVMVGLAAIDGRTHVTEEDWHLAGLVMLKSDRTREAVQATLTKAAEQSNIARGRHEGVRELAKAEAIEGTEVPRVAQAVLRWLGGRGEVSWSDARGARANRDRAYFEQAIEHLEASGSITLRTNGEARFISARPSPG